MSLTVMKRPVTIQRKVLVNEVSTHLLFRELLVILRDKFPEIPESARIYPEMNETDHGKGEDLIRITWTEDVQ